MIAVRQHMVTCTNCGDMATLHVWPDKYAGIWECTNCGTSNEHKHLSFHTENITEDAFTADDHRQYQFKSYVCDDCGVLITDSMLDEYLLGDCGI